jgi:hypothetical protein
MIRKKKPDPQQNIFDLSSVVASASQKEGVSPFIIVGSAKDITLVQLEIPGSDVIVVKCGACGREIWTEYYEDGIKFICGACCELLPR